MRFPIFVSTLLLIAAAPALADAPTPQPAPSGARYLVTDLGSLEGLDIRVAETLNDLGQVIVRGPSRSAVWRDGKLTDLGLLEPSDPTDAIQALSINNRGQIVGVVNPPGASRPQSRAFLWQDGKMTDLGSTPDFKGAHAAAINDAGFIAGYVLKEWNFGPRTLALFQNGKVAKLDATLLNFNRDSNSLAVNEHGHVAGTLSEKASRQPRAFLWDGKSITLIDTIPNTTVACSGAINASDQFVGGFNSATGLKPYVIRDAKMIELPLPEAISQAVAFGINDAAQIVGGSNAGNAMIVRGGAAIIIIGGAPGAPPAVLAGGATPNAPAAILWNNDKPIDLNTLIAPNAKLRITSARAINNAGEIAANADVDGKPSAVLLSPNPAFARLVFADPAQVTPEIKDRVNNLVAKLDSDSYPDREAASRELATLGPDASLILRQLDASKLTPEQDGRIKMILKQVGQLSAEEADLLKNDKPFLLSCLYLDDASLRTASLAQLEKIASQKLGPDPKGSRADRLAPLAEIRRKVLALPPMTPAALPTDAVETVIPKIDPNAPKQNTPFGGAVPGMMPAARPGIQIQMEIVPAQPPATQPAP